MLRRSFRAETCRSVTSPDNCQFWLCLEELVGDTKSFVRFGNRPLALSFQAGKRSDCVNVLRDYDALVVDLVDHIRFTIGDVEYVFPVGYLPHVSPGPKHVSHHLSHRVHAVDSISCSDGCQSRRVFQDLQDILSLRVVLQLDHGEVEMSDVEGPLRGHSCNVQFGKNGLRVWSLMGRNMSLRDDSVDESILVALPRVSSSPDHDNSRLSHPEPILECSNGSADSGCVAAHDPRSVLVQILLIVTLGNER